MPWSFHTPTFYEAYFHWFFAFPVRSLEKLGEGRWAFCCGFLGCWRKIAAEYYSTAMAVQVIHGRGSKPLHRAKSVWVKGLNCCNWFTHQQQVRVGLQGCWGGGRGAGRDAGCREGRSAAQLRRLAQLAGLGSATQLSHLLQDEPAAGYPVLHHPGESPPSPFVGRAGPGRATAFTFSPFSWSTRKLTQPTHAGRGDAVSEGEHLHLPKACSHQQGWQSWQGRMNPSTACQTRLSWLRYLFTQYPRDRYVFLQF